MVHLELVSDATTQTFLAALDRLISRRGRVERMRSDQGRQFVGAIKELEEQFLSWNYKNVAAQIARRGIHWTFNAPWQGGIWESVVKSTKYYLQRTLRDTNVRGILHIAGANRRSVELTANDCLV